MRTHILLLVLTVPLQLFATAFFAYFTQRRVKKVPALFNVGLWIWMVGFLIWASGVIGILQEMLGLKLALGIGVPAYIVWILVIYFKVFRSLRSDKAETRGVWF